MLTETTEIIKIISDMKKIKIIEIGVFRAENAKACLEKFDIHTFILIDPYVVLDYLPKYFGSKKIVRKNKKIAKKNLKPFERKEIPKLIWIEEFSEKVTNLQDNFYDIVYIDGNHDYDCVLRDIKTYLPKLKKGGLIIGDDFYDPEWNVYIIENKLVGGGLKSVSKAVKEYCDENNINFKIDYPANKKNGGSLKWWWQII